MAKSWLMAGAICAGWIAVGSSGVAVAETSELRIARQFSLGYLPFNLMERLHLIEKHAKAAGLPDVKVTWATFNGPSAMNDALLSNSVDVVAGGLPGLITLWARTKGLPIAVKGISAFCSHPVLLNTRNPNITSISDFSSQDKITLPSVKVSLQAIVLQMAAAKLWGQDNYAKLDPLTVAMAPPDATIALLSGAPELGNAFATLPFQYQQLDHKEIHTVLNSFDVLDGPHTGALTWTSTRFHDSNPLLYKALIAAIEEATAMLHKSVEAGSQYWIENTRSKIPLDQVVKIAGNPQITWTMTPQKSMRFAEFMHAVGSIKQKPADWKELFFPEVHHLPGN
jgi:NitT/TauT family transport system substrate-binding protein